MSTEVQLASASIEAVAQRVAALLGGRGKQRIEPDAIYTPIEAAPLIAMHPETLRRKLRHGVINGSRRSGD